MTAGRQAHDDHPVGLQALGPVDRHELQVDPPELASELREVPRFGVPVAPEDQDARASGRVDALRDCGERLADDGVPAVLARESDVYARGRAASLRRDALAELVGILRDESSRDVAHAVSAPERLAQIAPLGRSEILPKFAHDRDVRAGEAVDGLPVVADREELRRGVLREQCTHEPRPRAAGGAAWRGCWSGGLWGWGDRSLPLSTCSVARRIMSSKSISSRSRSADWYCSKIDSKTSTYAAARSALRASRARARRSANE